MTDGGTLTLSDQACHEEAMGETMYNTYTNAYVFRTRYCKNLLPVIKNRYMTTTEPIPYKEAVALNTLFMEKYPEQTDTGVLYGIRFRTLQTNSTIANNFILQASMLYGAVVLMVICLTVLSLRRLLDTGQWRFRFYCPLRKLGVEEDRISAN